MTVKWTETHREALELTARVARRDQPEDECHPFLADTLDAALAEIARLTTDEQEYQQEIQIAVDQLRAALAEVDRLTEQVARSSRILTQMEDALTKLMAILRMHQDSLT